MEIESNFPVGYQRYNFRGYAPNENRKDNIPTINLELPHIEQDFLSRSHVEIVRVTNTRRYANEFRNYDASCRLPDLLTVDQLYKKICHSPEEYLRLVYTPPISFSSEGKENAPKELVKPIKTTSCRRCYKNTRQQNVNKTLLNAAVPHYRVSNHFGRKDVISSDEISPHLTQDDRIKDEDRKKRTWASRLKHHRAFRTDLLPRSHLMCKECCLDYERSFPGIKSVSLFPIDGDSDNLSNYTQKLFNAGEEGKLSQNWDNASNAENSRACKRYEMHLKGKGVPHANQPMNASINGNSGIKCVDISWKSKMTIYPFHEREKSKGKAEKKEEVEEVEATVNIDEEAESEKQLHQQTTSTAENPETVTFDDHSVTQTDNTDIEISTVTDANILDFNYFLDFNEEDIFYTPDGQSQQPTPLENRYANVEARELLILLKKLITIWHEDSTATKKSKTFLLDALFDLAASHPLPTPNQIAKLDRLEQKRKGALEILMRETRRIIEDHNSADVSVQDVLAQLTTTLQNNNVVLKETFKNVATKSVWDVLNRLGYNSKTMKALRKVVDTQRPKETKPENSNSIKFNSLISDAMIEKERRERVRKVNRKRWHGAMRKIIKAKQSFNNTKSRSLRSALCDNPKSPTADNFTEINSQQDTKRIDGKDITINQQMEIEANDIVKQSPVRMDSNIEIKITPVTEIEKTIDSPINKESNKKFLTVKLPNLEGEPTYPSFQITDYSLENDLVFPFCISEDDCLLDKFDVEFEDIDYRWESPGEISPLDIRESQLPTLELAPEICDVPHIELPKYNTTKTFVQEKKRISFLPTQFQVVPSVDSKSSVARDKAEERIRFMMNAKRMQKEKIKLAQEKEKKEVLIQKKKQAAIARRRSKLELDSKSRMEARDAHAISLWAILRVDVDFASEDADLKKRLEKMCELVDKGSRDTSKIERRASGITGISYSSHFNLVNDSQIKRFSRAFAIFDTDMDGIISSDDLEKSVMAVHSLRKVSAQFLRYVVEVLKLDSLAKISIKMFSVICALLEKMVLSSQISGDVDSLQTLDYMELERKIEFFREMFYMNGEESRGNYIQVDALDVELAAGGLDGEERKEIIEEIHTDESGAISFIDYMAYIPLLISIHERIINNALR